MRAPSGPDLKIGAASSSSGTSAENVYRLVRAIPRGRVTTYGALARQLGLAARSVGGAMAKCPGDVTWWRVVGAGGTILTRHRLDGMGEEQTVRLESEGVAFDPGGRVRLDLHAIEPDDLEDPSADGSGRDQPCGEAIATAKADLS